MAMASAEQALAPGGFCHEALLYRGEAGFLDGTVPFVRAGLDGAQPILVVVGAAHIAALRSELGPDADAVHFADMAEVGHNPARIIPAWRDFLDRNGGDRPVRGIGEPIWPGRDPATLAECQRHETLLNVAFTRSGSWALLCPYDIDALPSDVIEEAERGHPFLMEHGEHRGSAKCRALDAMAAPFDDALAPAPADARPFVFRGSRSLAGLRTVVAGRAVAVGFGHDEASELVLAVNEVATNSIRYGGGEGILRMWRDGDALICELRDTGHIDAPLVGRVRPSVNAFGGRGLWMANQLCDLVQLRTTSAGNVVRVHMRLASA
jgi:anti-sigma regulatory factor (Ser/Thr protein kinase)